jgi:hypothetical protein
MIDRASTAPRRWRSGTTTKPVRIRANQNTKRGRRLADLFHALMDRVGNPIDVMIQADVLRAVELRVAAEDLRAKVLAGQPCEPDALVRLENLASRAERRLGKAPNKTPSVAEYLARRDTEQKGQPS